MGEKITLVRTQGEKEDVTWTERVDLFDNERANYYFFRPTPLCEDGYKYEMDEELKKREWNCGMMGLTYKEDIFYTEIPNCINYRKAYEKTYDPITGKTPLAEVPLRISEFLDMVDSNKAEIEKEHNKEHPEKPTLKKLVSFLINEGFEYNKTF